MRFGQPSRKGDTGLFQIGQEGRKAFFERATLADRIPNKMSDPERSKVLPAIPRGEPGNRACTFVLPEAPANFVGLGIRKMNTLAMSDR